ncbi:thiamine phosphate synthase [Spirulina subsalsa FACHB-351]|uniref:Thiamine-phosphate synthase n=1 Tax=Spirulina subsalsa FACHB-351 TaxID=234711 RepID=A0ABT3L4Q4_9CYAN|nr:thiamine phosphate synthase [Spirulina subsalsa]MCW6036478.1 thiamine phosphate synthase [Spirulina subsalsa FACHB-351]
MGEQNQPPLSNSQAIYRILDANLDRAREGLRIIEEWCRFGLNDSDLTQLCKQMRQQLGQWHSSELRQARDTPGDPGTHLTHPQEVERTDIEHLLQVNLCRVQEALRVLEEYAKLYNTQMAARCKQMRYEVYSLESELLGKKRHYLLEKSALYLVTSPSGNLFAVVEAALQGGLTLVQYREKNADDTVRFTQAQKLCQLCHQYGALFIVNDRIDLALAVKADGVHLGQQDAPIALARQLLGPQRIIGRSTTNPGEMEKAIAQGADYIGVGPVYETPTKPDKAPAGFEYIRHALENCPIPWFAIGGINSQNLPDVLKAGARRIAVVRAIMQAEQPTLMTQYFLSQLQHPVHYV